MTSTGKYNYTLPQRVAGEAASIEIKREVSKPNRSMYILGSIDDSSRYLDGPLL